MSRVGPILAVTAALLCVPLFGAPPQMFREVRIESSDGESRITIRGSISGYVTDDYRVRAESEAQAAVTLLTDNPDSYFDIVVPGEADTALFVGPIEGNHFEGGLPGSGRIAIRIYLGRNAARRAETANYTLKMTVVTAHGVSVESGP